MREERILVVGEPTGWEGMHAALSALGRVEWMAPYAAAKSGVDPAQADLVLLDLDLLPPDESREQARHILAQPLACGLPVVLISAEGSRECEIASLEAGVELVRKAGDHLVLRARVLNLLRRGRGGGQAVRVHGRLRLAPHRRAAWRREGEDWQALHLSPSEFRILEHLVQHRDRFVPRDEIVAEVWDGLRISQSALSTHVSNLRLKLGPLRKQLLARRGAGYCWSSGEPADDAP